MFQSLYKKMRMGTSLFTSDPDHCCHINKVQPLDGILADNDVWINGVRADQSAVRKAMEIEQPAPHNVIRFHPNARLELRRIFTNTLRNGIYHIIRLKRKDTTV